MKLEHFNRGLVPNASEPQTRERELVLVQAKDDEGFWVNLYEARSVRDGIRFAAACHRTEPADLRVVRGLKREVVREFFGT